MARKTAHVISHTHWDREWYLPYEKHHMRLIQMMDSLLDTFKRDADFRHFHLDGQTIVLEDYLQVRPERRGEVEQYIRDGRLHIGPWYVLQDEFLTSSEANIRNLLIGHRDARHYGSVTKIGYFPDSFGNMGQAPQILQQADISTAAFGRGVKPTGFNNQVSDEASYESPFSEMMWEAPDGSRVLGILFANWYSNGNEIPTHPASARKYWAQKLSDAERYASTGHLLYMNGCDHQPVQTDLSAALQTARELYPDMNFVHSHFDQYVEELRKALPEQLSVVRGELRSQRTDGWGTLVNTASSRMYIKQMNQQAQTLLEKVAEPLATFAYLRGHAYPHHVFNYAWKTLMQNHPHDSICGCSVDEVHDEMVTRFRKSRAVAETIIEESLQAIASHIDTETFRSYGEQPSPFVVMNTTGWVRSGTVTTDVDVARIYFRDGTEFEEMKAQTKSLAIDPLMVVDAQGHQVAANFEDLGIRFGYDLPDDKFRQPYFARTVRVRLEADDVPALGYKTYALLTNASQLERAKAEDGLLYDVSARRLENRNLVIDLSDDGSWSLKEKQTGRIYQGLGIYEDVGDIGNEYMFRQPDGDTAITTKGLSAEISAVENTPWRAVVETVHHLDIPAGANDLLEEEMRELVWFTNRKSQRSADTVPLVIRTTLELNQQDDGVTVRVAFDNQAKQHRLRVLLPTDLEAKTHFADSIFEVVERDTTPAPEWTNPSNCQHQQAFVTVGTESHGLTVSNRGLPEYEVLRDGRNTIALTLVRSVAELGDWGYFPTPGAQCQGEQQVEFRVTPHTNQAEPFDGGFVDAYQFQVPWQTTQVPVHRGDYAPETSFLTWHGPSIVWSTLKVSESTGDVMARWVNVSRRHQTLEFSLVGTGQIWRSDVLERRQDRVPKAGDGASVKVDCRPAEIVTYSMHCDCP